MLRKNPGFAAVATLSLALGIGANTTVFTMVNALLLQPLLPVAEPDRVAWVLSRQPNDPVAEVSYPDFVDFRDQNQSFSLLSASGRTALGMRAEEGTVRVWAQMVTGNFFHLLQTETVLGRTFSEEDTQGPAARPVAVLSHAFWERRFASSSEVLGRTIVLNGQDFAVVGVTSKDFHPTQIGFSPDLWLPLVWQEKLTGDDSLHDRSAGWLFVIGLLKPGVALEQAEANMKALARQLELAYPDTNKDRSVRLALVSDGHPELRGGAARVSLFLLAMVGLVLLIACANVANLLLSQAAERRKEIAIRAALGASRARLLRQLLTESTLLSLLGGLAGFLLALWTSRFMQLFRPPAPIPQDFHFELDFRVFGFTMLVALGTGMLLGFAPARQSTRLELTPALKDETFSLRPGDRKFSLRNLLVVSQVTLCMVLLLAAGLFLRSFWNTYRTDPGFETKNILILTLHPAEQRYSKAEAKTVYRQVLERAAALPGVHSASLTSWVPLGIGYLTGFRVSPQGDSNGAAHPGTSTFVSEISPDYFRTLGIPLLYGRDFNPGDTQSAPRVAIINDTLSRSLWAQQNPLGQWIGEADTGRLMQVVGIIPTTKHRTLQESPVPQLYLPLSQNFQKGLTILLRTDSDPQNLVAPLRRELEALDPNLGAAYIRTMKEHMVWPLWGARVAAVAFGGFSLLALALALAGIYGVISYHVKQRTKELGIRLALGAQRRDILRLIVGEGMRLALIGVCLGWVSAAALGHLLANFLYGIEPSDPFTLLATSTLLVGMASLACWLPARRATKIAPMEALRCE